MLRVTRTRALIVAVLLCAFALVGWRKYQTHELENRLATIAGEIAKRPVHVHCQGSIGAALDVTGEAGTVWFGADGKPADTTDLKHDICVRLDHYPQARTGAGFACVVRDTPCPLDTLKTLHALHTLAHEAWHLEGVQNEAQAECYAIQSTALVAGRLGASPSVAEASARVVATQIYPRMPSEYVTSDCHDGGSLDLHPDSPVWP
jgi:hypothetical protein